MDTRTYNKIISASSAERWTACSASAIFADQVPQVSSGDFYSSEGTIAHKVVNIYLENYRKGSEYLEQAKLEANKLTGVTEAMHTYALAFLGCLVDIIDTSENWGSEVKILFDKEKNIGGTCDFFAIKNDTLYIRDYKYGEGSFVHAKNNLQLAFYAVCFKKEFTQIKTASIGIFQPRISDEESKIISIEDLTESDLEIYEKFFTNAINKIDRKEVVYNQGSHCQYCPVKPRCPAWYDWYKNVLSLKEIMEKRPLTKKEAEEIHLIADDLISWMKSIQAYNLKLAEQGEVFTSLKLVEKRGYRTWMDELEDEIIFRLKMLNIDPFDKKLISFSKVEKTLGKNEFNKQFNDCITYAEPGYKLVSRAERGEEVIPKAGIEFDITNMEEEL